MFRFFFILWLVLPQSQGATQLYMAYVGPFLSRHDKEIDEFVGTAHYKILKLSSKYLSQLLIIARKYAAHYILGSELNNNDTNGFDNSPQSVQPSPAFIPQSANNLSNETKSTSSTSAAAFFNKLANKFKSDSQQLASAPINQFENVQPPNQSYLDSFFSQFKNPPSLSSVSEARDITDSGVQKSLFSSLIEPVARAGAAVIQSGLHLPPVSSESYQSQLHGPLDSNNYAKSNNASGNFNPISENSASNNKSNSNIINISNPKRDSYSGSLNTPFPSSSSSAQPSTTQSSIKSRFSDPFSLSSKRSVAVSTSSSSNDTFAFNNNDTNSIYSATTSTIGNNAGANKSSLSFFSKSSDPNTSSASLATSDNDYDFVRHESETGTNQYDPSSLQYPNAGSLNSLPSFAGSSNEAVNSNYNGNANSVGSSNSQHSISGGTSINTAAPSTYSRNSSVDDSASDVLRPDQKRKSGSWFSREKN